MNIKNYVEKASRTDAPLGSKQEHNFHMIFGMLTEVGELADIFKKNLAYGKEIDWVNVKEETGDLMWYIANFCKGNNFDLEEILETNINKLISRYPEKFTQKEALERNLDLERKILETAYWCSYCKHDMLEVLPGKYQCGNVCCTNHFVNYEGVKCDKCGSEMRQYIDNSPYGCSNKDCEDYPEYL